MNADFLCNIKTSVTNANVGGVINNMHKNQLTAKSPLLLVARYISPTTIEQLVENGFSSVDYAGNYMMMHL